MAESLVQQAVLFIALSLRPAALFVAAPPFAAPFVPVLLRAGLGAAVALLLLPGYAAAHPGVSPDLALFLSEPLAGLILAFVLRLAFAAVQLAGDLLDIDTGLSLSQFLDPVTGSPVQVLSGLQTNLALVLYLSLGGHGHLLRALAGSYDRLPLGGIHLSPAFSRQAVAMAGGLFSDGLRIALPILTATLLATITLGAATRAFPEANAFALGQPVKLLAAVIALAALLPIYAAIYGDLFASAHSGGLRLLDLLR